MHYIRWITGLTSALLIAGFTAINREAITVTWIPFTQPQEIQLSLVAMAILSFGFILGITTHWLNSAPLRSQKRRQKKQIESLEKQLKVANKNKKDDDGFTKTARSSLQQLKKRIK